MGALPAPMLPGAAVFSMPSVQQPVIPPQRIWGFPTLPPPVFFPVTALEESPRSAVLQSAPTSALVNTQPVGKPLWQNNLKELMNTNRSIMYALHLRTFAAQDQNQDGRISVRLGENGTFLSAIPRLDELAALGVNTIHLLPIHPPGRMKRLGEAGSVYAPSNYWELNPEYDTPGNGLSVIQEARLFIQEAHRRGIHVMVDVPSCASHDLAQQHPELIARDLKGNPLVPTNWIDILMFQNTPQLLQYYEKFFDLMVNQLGVDGFRVDVARARPPWFWQHFLSKYPNHGWLAESYTEEDASPMKNIPRDIPETLLKIGFDSIYGQFHIFHSMKANEYLRYLIDGHSMLKRAGIGKSFIGSFLTHDDPSLMEHGGVPMYLLSAGLMATQPWTNPYILDGFLTGYPKHFDIFNFRKRPTGNHPEIGGFLKQMLEIRKQYGDVITQGLFTPVPVTEGDESQIVAFARHHQGKTLLVVANKDVNARHKGKLYIPGLKIDQALQNLVPSYGAMSQFVVDQNWMNIDLGPGRFHLFEINTPELPIRLQSYR
jgi:glycosidase